MLTSLFRLVVAAPLIANTPSTNHPIHNEFSFSSKNSTPAKNVGKLKINIADKSRGTGLYILVCNFGHIITWLVVNLQGTNNKSFNN